MKELAKRTAVAALVGVVSAGMLAGCGGEKKLDGTKTVATVNGTEIPMGLVSLDTRINQAQMEAMYASFMGSSGATYAIWDTEGDDGQTYGEQEVDSSLEDIELMYLMKEKAADYGVEFTEEDQAAVDEAAAAFIEANTEEALADLGVTEDQVKTYLELRTYKERIHDPIIADVDTEVSDEEAQQSTFTYLSISTSDLEDDEIEEKKADAQKILDTMLEDSDADFSETCTSVSEDYSTSTGQIDANESEDEDDEDSYSSYPDEVVEVLRTLKDGEMGPDVIETDSALYVVQMNNTFDEDATESQKESIVSQRESDLYDETTQGWLDDADIEVNDKVLDTLTVTDTHKFTIVTPAAESEETDDTAAVDATATTDDEGTEVSVVDDADTAEETTEDSTEAADSEDAEASEDSEEETSEDADAAEETADTEDAE